MTDIPVYFLLLACGSFLLLGISMASASAQYLQSKQAETALVLVKQPPLR
jgi:hypothetical protein